MPNDSSRQDAAQAEPRTKTIDYADLWTRAAAHLPALAVLTFNARIGQETTEHRSYLVRPVRIDTRAGLVRFHSHRQPMQLAPGPINLSVIEPSR